MLDDAIKSLASGPNFAAFTTLLKDGSPMTHIMWVDADDEHVLINTEVHRAKFKNVERDPRVVVSIFDAASPYHYAEVRGTVVDTVTGPEARAHIDKLSQKYSGKPYDDSVIQSERVILKIAPTRQRSQ
jgi:PPOX class probable F420-dependent enzyme